MRALLSGLALFAFAEVAHAGSDPGVVLRAVVAALNNDDPAGADTLASQALATGMLSEEDRARVLLNRGLAREKLQRPGDALGDYDAALALDTLQPMDKARALFDRGVVYDEMGRDDEAIADYSAALKLDPDFAAALNNRANVWRRAGRLDDAKRDYLASLAAGNHQPEFSDYGMGQIAEAEHDPSAARDWYGKALTANPDYALAIHRAAVLGDTPPPQLKPLLVAENTTAKSDPPIRLLPPARETTTYADGVQQATTTTAPPAPQADPGLRPDIGDAISDDAKPAQIASVEPPHTPRSAARAAGGGGLVQLGAMRSEADAAATWGKLVSHAGGLLDGMTPQIILANIPGKGRFYRLRSAPGSGVSPGGLCTRLKAQGLDCFAVK
ncbi:MAG TPA: tetratricopeptide repeat protein [Rhizomicrobium sp.]|jgi:tetratricopeptide (TPR) repeat protein